MGHTPGPWIVFSDRDDELKVRSAQDDFIADCADGFWSDEADGWIMAAESEANARLIAAAPDLLKALEAICAEAATMSMTMRRRAIFNKGVAAIAKATGQ
jgi:hypothetical protein